MPAVRRTLLGALCSVFALALTASASADTVSIAAPTAPPPEDVAFALTMTGTTDIHADVFGSRLIVKVRPAGGVPCAVNSRVDAGSEIAGESLGNKGGSYQKPATYTPPDSGDYLVCAWVAEDGDQTNVFAGPVTVTVAVRPPALSATMTAPTAIRPDATLAVAIDYSAEVSRSLKVVFAQAPNCGVSARALEDASANDVTVYNETVSGAGHADKTATVPSASGQYRLCGFFTEPFGNNDAPESIIAGPVVNVAIPKIKCANIKTRRRAMTSIEATGPSCGSARSVARRWGTPRKTPRFIGTYTCRASSGKRVTCTSSAGKVTFRYRSR